MTEKSDFDSPMLRTALAQFDEVAGRLQLEQDIRERLRHPRRALVVSIPVRMDDGNTAVFTGYRVHHNSVLGPTKGGLRYDSEVSLGRGQRPGHADVLEVRPDEPALRRRQGRRPLQSPVALPPGAGGADPPVHGRDHPADRARPGHPRPRHGHGRADDGLDDGHLLDDPGPDRARAW